VAFGKHEGLFFSFSAKPLAQHTVQENGFVKDYKNHRDIFRWFQLFKALPFLPPQCVSQGLEYIKSIRPYGKPSIDSW
jgi:hypothetical protein